MSPQMMQVQQPQVLMQDPFSGVSSNSLALPPNSSISAEAPALLDSILTMRGINKPLADEFFWAILNDNAMTFLNDESKQRKMLRYDILKIDAQNDMSWYDYTFAVERKWGIMRNVFDTRLDRSLGTTDSNRKNERIIQQSMLTESRQISQHEDPNSYQREGFIQRLLRSRNKR